MDSLQMPGGTMSLEDANNSNPNSTNEPSASDMSMSFRPKGEDDQTMSSFNSSTMMIRMTAGAGTVSKSAVSNSKMSGMTQESSANMESFENLMDPSQIIRSDDFEKIKVIGRGAFAKVYLVKKVGTENYYAMKILKKK